MIFYGLTVRDITSRGVKDGRYYAFDLGEKIIVTSLKKYNTNTILSSCLSSNKLEDKLMMKYYPSSRIYFDEDLINGDCALNLVSCQVDRNTSSVYIGKLEKYEVKSGVLALSGVLSANGFVEKERPIYSNSQMEGRIKSKVRIMSVGLRGNKLFGLYLIQKERGIAVGIDDSDDIALSVKNLQLRNCNSWTQACISDWFDKCKIITFCADTGCSDGNKCTSGSKSMDKDRRLEMTFA